MNITQQNLEVSKSLNYISVKQSLQKLKLNLAEIIKKRILSFLVVNI